MQGTALEAPVQAGIRGGMAERDADFRRPRLGKGGPEKCNFFVRGGHTRSLSSGRQFRLPGFRSGRTRS